MKETLINTRRTRLTEHGAMNCQVWMALERIKDDRINSTIRHTQECRAPYPKQDITSKCVIPIKLVQTCSASATELRSILIIGLGNQ